MGSVFFGGGLKEGTTLEWHFGNITQAAEWRMFWEDLIADARRQVTERCYSSRETDDSALGHLGRGQRSMDGTALGVMDWLWMVLSRRDL